jgi:hypothetical protein
MTSTRNKNNMGNFNLEHSDNRAYLNNMINDVRIYKTSYLPGEGLLGGSYPYNVMSNNQVDIETSLFGIGSTNLIEPKPNTIHLGNLKKLDSLNVCNKQPLVMPEPFIVKSSFLY